MRLDGTRFKSEYQGGRGGNTVVNPSTQPFQSFYFNAEAKPGPEGAKGSLVDSGCNKHMTLFKEDLTDLGDSAKLFVLLVTMAASGLKVAALYFW